MRQFTTFTIGLLARLVSIIATLYGDWLLRKILAGTEHFDFLRDLKRFFRWLLTRLADWLCGRRSGYEDDGYEAELFAAR